MPGRPIGFQEFRGSVNPRFTVRPGVYVNETFVVISNVYTDTNCSVLSSYVVGVVIARHPSSVGPRTGHLGGRVLGRNEAATVIEYLSIPVPGNLWGEGVY
jgi:hypothetical protein